MVLALARTRAMHVVKRPVSRLSPEPGVLVLRIGSQPRTQPRGFRPQAWADSCCRARSDHPRAINSARFRRASS